MNNLETLSNLLKEKNLTIGSIESLTGGLFATSMTSIPGASSIFKGAIVTYMTEEKVRLLGIEQEIVDTYGVVSKEVASLMAKLGKEKLNCDISISFTGNAGPDAMENKPVGTVYVGVSLNNKVIVRKLSLKGSRQDIRNSCIEKGCEFLIEQIDTNF